MYPQVFQHSIERFREQVRNIVGVFFLLINTFMKIKVFSNRLISSVIRLLERLYSYENISN